MLQFFILICKSKVSFRVQVNQFQSIIYNKIGLQWKVLLPHLEEIRRQTESEYSHMSQVLEETMCLYVNFVI